MHRFKMMMLDLYSLAREQLRRFFTRERIIVFEKSLSNHPELQVKVDVDVRLAQSVDIARLAERFGARGLKDGIMRGHLCFIADMNGEIAHYKWVALDEAYVSELNRNIRVSYNSAYIYSSYTVPKFRGFGLDTKVTMKVFDYLHERGIEKVYILVQFNNIPSLRVMQKVGYRKMGEVRFVQVFGFKKYECESRTEKDCSQIKKMLSLQ